MNEYFDYSQAKTFDDLPTSKQIVDRLLEDVDFGDEGDGEPAARGTGR